MKVAKIGIKPTEMCKIVCPNEKNNKTSPPTPRSEVSRYLLVPRRLESVPLLDHFEFLRLDEQPIPFLALEVRVALHCAVVNACLLEQPHSGSDKPGALLQCGVTIETK